MVLVGSRAVVRLASSVWAVPLSVADEVFAALGQALGDDLGVERVGKDLGPFLEGTVGRDRGGAAVVVALADDLEGELGLSGVHLEAGKVVDDEQLSASVFAENALDAAVQLGAM